MSVSHPCDEGGHQRLIALVTWLLDGMSNSFFLMSWKPWLRYMITITIVVVLIIIYRNTAWTI